MTVNSAPFTAAEENAGGVLLVADSPENSAASLPDRSRNGLAPAPVGFRYSTATASPWVAAAAKVSVTTLPSTRMPVGARLDPP